MTTRTLEDRQVAGICVTEWPGSGPTVVALAGLSSSGMAWKPLAQALPDARVIAPHLRGRGPSQQIAGPTGLRGHARDVKAVIEQLDLTDVVLVGHSMGAYLAPVVAQELGGHRLRKLVLVDGGIPPKLPFFMGPALTRLTFRKQLAALDKDWPDVETMARKARMQGMLEGRPDLYPVVLEMLADETSGTPGALRPRLDVARAVADAADTFHGADVKPALQALSVPTYAFLAENMKKAGQRPFISDAAAAPYLDRITVKRLPGNHVTVLFAPEVQDAITS